MERAMKGLQTAIEQIGEDAVQKSIPVGFKIGRCMVHGAYLISPEIEACCPICPKLPDGNGTTATEVEHYIDIDPSHSLGTNPGQKINPYGV